MCAENVLQHNIKMANLPVFSMVFQIQHSPSNFKVWKMREYGGDVTDA
jgi:isocitrate dehydrogenase